MQNPVQLRLRLRLRDCCDRPDISHQVSPYKGSLYSLDNVQGKPSSSKVPLRSVVPHSCHQDLMSYVTNRKLRQGLTVSPCYSGVSLGHMKPGKSLATESVKSCKLRSQSTKFMRVV